MVGLGTVGYCFNARSRGTLGSVGYIYIGYCEATGVMMGRYLAPGVLIQSLILQFASMNEQLPLQITLARTHYDPQITHTPLH